MAGPSKEAFINEAQPLLPEAISCKGIVAPLLLKYKYQISYFCCSSRYLHHARTSCLLLITSLPCQHFRVNAIISWFTPGCFTPAVNICTLADDNTCCLSPTLYISHCEMLLYYHFLPCYTNKHVKHQVLRAQCLCSSVPGAYFRLLMQSLQNWKVFL